MSITDRMKENYELPYKYRLTKRTPVIIRIDGKAFHTFTKGFLKPFDPIMIQAMQLTTKKLCENIQGAVLGYTQSDEISILLQDYETLETSAWFDYEVQKLSSVSASMATLYFNYCFSNLVKDFTPSFGPFEVSYGDEDLNKLLETYKRVENTALFDARCFNIPKEEVTNYFYSRQLDAIRNSIQSAGQAYFKPKELDRKSCEDIKDMLLTVGVDWREYRACEQRGTTCIKTENGWMLHFIPPVFKDDRDYIESRIG